MKSLANRNCAEVRNPMNKENVKQSTVDIFCEKKELEKSCLDNAISKVPWLQKFKLIEDELQERPDFILERKKKFYRNRTFSY